MSVWLPRSMLAVLGGLALSLQALAQTYEQSPMLAERVAAGTLPPVEERLPETPLVTEPAEIGRFGGQIEWIAGRSRDIRIMNVYGYARLVGYDEDLNLVADILESYEVEEGRIFTLHLRPGMRWSDGEPFTTEDFRFSWEEIQLNEELRPFGPDWRMVVGEELPEVEIVDDYTIRYSWSRPNPRFLPAIAGATPMYLYSPAHYVRQFHADFTDEDSLAREVAAAEARDWISLFLRNANLYEASNPDLPVLQPWVNTTEAPSERFVFERNPYYHRVDPEGRQLPYIDRVLVNVADSSLISAQTGTGASDLQARHIRIDDFPFLSEGAEQNDYDILLWDTVLGNEIALYPNLNAADPVWREVVRDVRFRRALSLAINRAELNEIIFFGLGQPSNNTVVPSSPFWSEDLASRWAVYDIQQANALLDEMGLTERGSGGLRLLPDGRPLEIIVESAGERSQEIDALQLIGDSWRQIGVGLFVNNSQRDVFRNRVFSGEVTMSVWFGLDNGLITSTTVPDELAPVDQNWLQYPAWGQYWQGQGTVGEEPDLDWAVTLMDLYQQWLLEPDAEARGAITREMLALQAEQVTSIGTVQGVPQPIVVSNDLHNVPEQGVYSWDPGAHFGRYRMDTFWLDQ
ncbi:MAG: ABC transporter substrate-binding protein [Azospirillaceae bacterium]